MVNFWASLLAISVLIYLILDGLDLGIGMLFGLVKSERRRDAVLATISPVWDGNETWLVVAGVIAWGAFPLAYSMLLSAFYIPVLVMLLGLILRGVAFEFRSKSLASKWVWNVSFVVGSFAASFMQGAMVGAMVHGLHFVDREYSDGPAGWFTPFSALCGVGLCLGYSLLGASWLVGKSEGAIHRLAKEQIPPLAIGVIVFLVAIFAYSLAERLVILHRWLDRPYLLVFPLVGFAAAAMLARSIVDHNDHWPFRLVTLIFVAAFATLGLSFWPYMIPFVLTIDEAAAPYSSLSFMFWGEGLFVFPLMLAYVALGYHIFRGKAVIHHE